MIEDARRIDAQSHSRERALKHGGENRGAESFTGNISDEKRSAAIAEWKNVEVVSADCQAREVESSNCEMGVFAEIAWEKRLLNVAGNAEKRNHDHGAQALGNDALRCLQIHVGLREVFCNDGRLLLQRKLDCSLAGREAFGRKAKTSAAPCEFHSKRAAGVGFEEQAAVGIGYGDRVIQHVAQHDVER